MNAPFPQDTRPVPEALRSFTWENLEEWTDSGSIRRGKGYVGNVSDEGITEDGRIVATVSGHEDYATEISFDGKGLQGRCTCPVGHRCKHTVALILKCIDRIAENRPLPLLDPDDDRLEELREAEEWEDEEEEGEEDEEDDGNEGAVAAGGSGDSPSPVRLPPSRSKPLDELDEHIDSLDESAAKALLRDILVRHPDIRSDFLRSVRTARGDVAQLLKMARKELHRLARMDAYVNPWKHEFHVPDYTPLRNILQKLLDKKAFDELVAFGDDLKTETLSQIECAHDEGDTANQICSCMDVVAEAVRKSSLPKPKQMRWFFDILQNDDYGTYNDLYDPFDHPGDWKKSDWSAFADDIQKAFSSRFSKKDDSEYRRERWLNRLCEALSHADRVDESRTIRIDSYRKNRQYEDLAKLYRDEGDLTAAWDTAAKGLSDKDAPDRYGRNKENLRSLLREIAVKRGDALLALSLQAEDFFSSPSETEFFALLDTAKSESLDAAIRPWLVRFLETGHRPEASPPPSTPPQPPTRRKPGRPPKSGKAIAPTPKPTTESISSVPWPLPSSGLPLLSSSRHADSGATILLRIALREKNPSEILRRWKNASEKGRGSSYSPWNSYDNFNDRVADALADTYPDESLRIWNDVVRRNLSAPYQYAYDAIATAFRKMRPVMERLGRLDEWTSRIRALQTEYKRRPNFVKALAELIDPPAPARPILETRRDRR